MDFQPATNPPLRVLVVDDDPTIIGIYQEVLQRDGFAVATASSCAGAMRQMEQLEGDVQVLLIDLGLPDGDGADFARASAAKFGARPSLYVSGWTDEFWQLDDVPGRWVILRKPVPVKRLLAAVRWMGFGGDKPPELDETMP